MTGAIGTTTWRQPWIGWIKNKMTPFSGKAALAALPENGILRYKYF